MQAPGPHVPIPQVAESGQSAVGTLVWLALSPCPPPALAAQDKSSCPGSAWSWLTPAEPPPHPAVVAVLALTRATEKVPCDIPVPGWGQAQSQHWVRKGCHDATPPPAFIQVLSHPGMGLALKMLCFGVTAQPGQHRMLSHTPPQLLCHCTLFSGIGTPLAAPPTLSSPLKTTKYNQNQAGLGGRVPSASPGVHPALLPLKLPMSCTIWIHPHQSQE